MQKNRIINLFLVAVIYFLLANASEFLFEPTHTFFTIRLAPGFGLIATLIYGLPALFGIFLGEFLYFYFLHNSEITIPVSIALAANAVLYVYIGSRLIHRYVELPNQLTNFLDYFKFFILGGFAASLIPSLLAVYCISLIEPAVQQLFWLLGAHWWLGQMLGVLIISPIILCFVWKSIPIWQTRIPLVPVLLTMLLAVIVTIYAYATIQEKEKLKSLLEQKSLAMSSAIKLQISNYGEALHSIKSLFEYTPDIGPQEFEEFSNKIKARQSGVHAMSYQPLVKAHERHSYENRMREFYSNEFQIIERDGSGNFKRASDREEYTPITMRAIYDKNSQIMGFDTTTSVFSKSARQQTKATNKVAISRAFSLVSTTDSSKSVILYLSLSKNGLFSGYVAMSVYAVKVIQSAIESINMEGFALKVWDVEPLENNIIYSKNTLNPEDESGLSNIGNIRFISHDWVYELVPDSIHLVHLITSQLLVMIFCILLSSIVSVRLLEFTGKRLELSRRVLESEKHSRLLLDSTAEAIYGLGLNGDCTFCNAACLKMLGYEDQNDLLGNNMHELIHHTRSDGTPYPIEDCHIYEALQRSEGTHVDDELLWRADGSSFTAEYWSHPIFHEDKIVGLVVTFLDITVRKRAQQELAHREDELRLILDNLPGMVATFSDQFHYLAANRTYLDMFGLKDQDEILGKHIREVMGDQAWERVQPYMQRAIAGERVTYDVVIPYASGPRHVQAIYVPNVNNKGHVDKFYALIVDVHERKLAEQELKKHRDHLEELVKARTSELESANQAKSIFLANMSHELRTPLNAVLGFSELMARDPQTTQKQNENLNVINRSGQHLLALINDVLDMSKIEAGHTELELKPVDLHLLLEDMSDMFGQRAETRTLQFSLELTPTLPQYVLLDMGKLRQVLINLLGNAIKFTEVGGVILRADANELADDKCQLCFEIVDTGIGIPADKIETIFEPFVQTGHSPDKHQGTGLGLAISRQFIQLMGGEITVESTPDKGSVFRFEIPTETTDATEMEQPVEEMGKRIVGLVTDEPEWRILIVEDETNNRLLLQRLLESVGFTVREAVNGEEAIQQFTDWQPQLICMDMRMPVMDGYEATRRIRELPGGTEVRILALTASAFKEQEIQILAAGCNAVLHKPFNEPEMFMAMAEQLGLHYVYEEDNDLLKQHTVSKPVLEDLQGLPDEWLDEFLTAVRLGDTEAMRSLTSTLDAEHAETKAKLDHCINDFQLQFLIDLLEENRATTDKA
jgi:PAS domain S-box-containing protein